MKPGEIERRLMALEQAVEEIKSRLGASSPSNRWWIDQAGQFADNPTYDEIVRLGAECRRSLRPEGKTSENPHS